MIWNECGLLGLCRPFSGFWCTCGWLNSLILCTYTLYAHTMSQRGSHLVFDNNFSKCGPIFKIFHQLIHEKILYVTYTSPAICCCTTLWKSKNPKIFMILRASSANYWHVFEDTLNTWFNIWQELDRLPQESRLLTLTDWLAFWWLSFFETQCR